MMRFILFFILIMISSSSSSQTMSWKDLSKQDIIQPFELDDFEESEAFGLDGKIFFKFDYLPVKHIKNFSDAFHCFEKQKLK